MKAPLFFLVAAAALLSAVFAATTPEGKKFLEENAKKDGVIVRESGLQYKILASGNPNSPMPRTYTQCRCHYRGTLIDGTEFDSSYSRGQPATFRPDQVIAGW